MAGLIDSIVGGGGLVQLPALFLFLPSHLAEPVSAVLGTNKLAAMCGTSVAAVQYARRVPVHWASLLPAAAMAWAASFLGAFAVTRLQSQQLKPMIFFLLAGVALYTFIRKDLGSWHTPRFSPAAERRVGMLVGAVIGFYDGFFGPGTGSFLVFIFIGLFGFDFLTASAHAKFINVATNFAALLCFGATSNIHWQYGLALGLCNVAGSWVGARWAITRGNRFIRAIFLLVVTAMIGRFGYDLFAPAALGR